MSGEAETHEYAMKFIDVLLADVGVSADKSGNGAAKKGRMAEAHAADEEFLEKNPVSSQVTGTQSRYLRLKTFLETRLFSEEWVNRGSYHDLKSKSEVFLPRNFGKSNSTVFDAARNIPRCWSWYKAKYRGKKLTAKEKKSKVEKKTLHLYKKFYFFVDPDASPAEKTTALKAERKYNLQKCASTKTDIKVPVNNRMCVVNSAAKMERSVHEWGRAHGI